MTVRAPYSGPWRGPSNTSGQPAYTGKAAVALKRTVSRAGYLKWQGFDDHYNKNLENALKPLQRKHSLPATGQTGRATFDVLCRLTGGDGKPAMDAVAVHLLEDEWQHLHPPAPSKAQLEARVREQIAAYWQTCIAHAAAWHYRQYRPVNYDVAPEHGGYDDCSSKATASFYWARKKTGIAVPDPNGNAYDGYGNTGSLYSHNSARKVGGNFEIGDLGLYGPDASRHVVCCIRPGDAQTAVWGSNGSEGGPYAVRLHYRPDLFAVVRPLLVS